MSFRDWLRGLLDEGRYPSQRQMAKAFGMGQPTVNNWLAGRRLPERESLRRISKATGKPVAEIMEMLSE